jgi:hypothetical protein
MSNATGAIALDASKIITTFDIDKPEVRAQFFRIRGNQGMNFFALLESLTFRVIITAGILSDKLKQSSNSFEKS